jgi:hypothetical protein
VRRLDWLWSTKDSLAASGGIAQGGGGAGVLPTELLRLKNPDPDINAAGETPAPLASSGGWGLGAVRLTPSAFTPG